jgi:RND family efflux transporter MFP subunit
MKKTNYIIAILFASSLFSCSGTEDKTAQETKSIPVKIGQVTSSQLSNMITASGTIEAQNSANLSTRMMGNVTNLNVKVGQRIKKGQTLITISSADLNAKAAQVEASVLQAESALQNAKKDFQRFKALFEKKSASEKELDDMTTRYDMAKANFEAAKQMKKEVQAQYAYTNISSPFDGMVVNTFVKVGDMANPGMPLVAVAGEKKYQAAILVSETDIANVKIDAEAKVLVKSINKEFNGKVKEISFSSKNTGGQYQVKIDLNDVSDQVYPGMFVNVRFSVKSTENLTSSVMIPKSALVNHGQLTGIYVIGNDDIAILRWLRMGKETNGQIEVLSGLQNKEKFIASADGKLYNGVKVTYQN